MAAVSPALIQAYRNEELTLDHLTAFAVTEDQEAQERVFGQLQMWQRNPDTIWRLLTHALIPATDRKALFVGLDTYTTAGETVQRDLFSEDRGGWITDAALLEQLVAERMEREARVIRAEGWRWVGSGQEAQAAAWNLRWVWLDKVALSAEDEGVAVLDPALRQSVALNPYRVAVRSPKVQHLGEVDWSLDAVGCRRYEPCGVPAVILALFTPRA